MRERMGSGGLRGLQILRSGVCNVRGGFDSHAFPPLFRAPSRAPLVALAVAVLCVHGVAFAAPATPVKGPSPASPGAPPNPHASRTPTAPAVPVTRDTSTTIGSAPDSLDVRNQAIRDSLNARAEAFADTAGEEPDTTAKAKRQPPAEPKGSERPRWVALRSLVLPGWGQVHNGAWTKAGLMVVGEGIFVTKIVNDRRALNDLNAQIDAAHAAHQAAVETDLVAQYNAACNYSLLGDIGGALDLREKCLPKLGHEKVQWAKYDSDFDPLRNHSRYKKLFERIDKS